jgi:hypothetical protein
MLDESSRLHSAGMAARVTDLYQYKWSALRIDSALLHRFAAAYHWDDGYDLLKRCIAHEKCALGTALLIYWMGKPHYFRQWADADDVPDFQRPLFDLLTSIERRVKAGKYKRAGISFDPRRHAKTDWTAITYDELPKNRELPAHMLIAVTKTKSEPFEPAAKPKRRR